jgi:hypothetical protein
MELLIYPLLIFVGYMSGRLDGRLTYESRSHDWRNLFTSVSAEMFGIGQTVELLRRVEARRAEVQHDEK